MIERKEMAQVIVQLFCFVLLFLAAVAIEAELQKIFKETGPMVKFLSEKAGVGLPGNSYGQLLVPSKAAQEAATYSIIGKDYIIPSYDWVIIHELTHQWWGNLITCKTLKDFWLNEGITSFMVLAWKEQRYGRKAYEDELNLLRKHVDLLREKGADKPLSYGGEYASNQDRRTVQYDKGALFMAQLRTVLGDDVFWNALRRSTREHAGGTVTSVDFERAVEKSSGRDLHGLFAEWMFGQ